MLIQAEPVEQLVADGVLLRLSSPAMVDALAGRAHDDAEAARLAAQIKADQERLTDFASMLATGEMSKTEWRTARDVVDQRLKTAQRQLNQLTHADALSGLDLASPQLAELFANLELERQHAIIAAVLECVEILPGRRGIQHVDPARVRPVWKL